MRKTFYCLWINTKLIRLWCPRELRNLWTASSNPDTASSHARTPKRSLARSRSIHSWSKNGRETTSKFTDLFTLFCILLYILFFHFLQATKENLDASSPLRPRRGHNLGRNARIVSLEFQRRQKILEVFENASEPRGAACWVEVYGDREKQINIQKENGLWRLPKFQYRVLKGVDLIEPRINLDLSTIAVK